MHVNVHSPSLYKTQEVVYVEVKIKDDIGEHYLLTM